MLYPQRGEGAEWMVVAARELIDCERSIDHFCFDSDCDYQLSLMVLAAPSTSAGNSPAINLLYRVL